MEHILKIRLQLEELKPGDIEKNMEKPAEGIEKAISGGMEKGAIAGGAAMIERMTSIQKAWKEFDWAHPINSIKNLFGGVVDWIKNRFGILGGLMIGAIVGLINVVRKLLVPQAILTKTFSQLAYNTREMIAYGEDFGTRVARGVRQVAEVAIVTGEALEDVANRFSQLAMMRVPIGEVKGLTQAAFLGAKALGANVDQMTEFVGTMRVMGRVSSDQITGRRGIIQSFSNIQDAVGLTEKEITGLIQTTVELTRHMSAFGATAQSIVDMAEATAKLTGMFGQLGLGADRASEIMNRLFDPTQLGENAYLIRSMGFSMQEYLDMLAGGEVDQRKLTGGLIEAAKEIEDMQMAGVHVMALQQRAQMMGFRNAAEALRLAKEGPNILRDMEKATEAGVDYEKRAAEGMSAMNEALGRVRNRFMAFFGKAAAPLIELLTKVVAKLEEKWIKNESVIRKFAEAFTDKIANFIEKFDFNKLLEWFDKVGNVIKWVTTHLKTLATVAGIAAGAFVGFKVLGAVVPMVGQLTGALGGLTKGLKGVGAAGEAASGAGKGVSSFMKFMAKAAIGVAILFLLAGAIWVLAQALKTFSKDVDWGGMLKAGVALLAVTAVMLGLGLLFATPVGQAAIAGAIAFGFALLIFSAALLVLANALIKFGDATDKITALANIASPELAKNLMIVGAAIAAFVKQFGFLQLLKAPLLIALGAAIKEFAIALWILGKIKEVDSATKAMEAIGKSIKVLAEGRFRNNAIVIGETMRALADALMTLSKIEPSAFKGLAPSMESVAKGFRAWIDAVVGTQGKGFFEAVGTVAGQALTKFQPIAAAFKDLAIAIWILSKSGGQMGSIATDMDKLPGPLRKVADAFVGINKQAFEGMAAFGSFGQALAQLQGADMSGITASMAGLPQMISALGNALPAWTSRDVKRGADEFVNFVKRMAEAPPTKIATEVQTTGTTKLTTEISGESRIMETIRGSIATEISKVTQKLDDIFTAERSDIRVGIKSMTSLLDMAGRTGIKTR